MTRNRLPVFASLLLVVFSAGCSDGPTVGPSPLPVEPPPVVVVPPTPTPTPTFVSLTGTVKSNTGIPLNGAIVTILDGTNAGKSTTTSTNGAYRFDGLVASNGNLSVKAIGYNEVSAGIYIDGVNALDFVLNPAVIDPNGSWVGSGTGVASDGTLVSVIIELEVSSREVKTWVVRYKFSTTRCDSTSAFTSYLIPIVGNSFESNIKESKFAYTPTVFRGTFSSSTTVTGAITLVKNPILVPCPVSATIEWSGTKK